MLKARVIFLRCLALDEIRQAGAPADSTGMRQPVKHSIIIAADGSAHLNLSVRAQETGESSPFPSQSRVCSSRSVFCGTAGSL